jgi:hypothetical protein
MPTASPELKCPHCAAKVGRNWKTCWLCGLELPSTLPTVVGPETGNASREPASSVVASIAKVAGVFLGIAILLILIGLLANEEYGGAIALTVLLLPAGIVTLTKSLRKRSEGVELPVLEKIGTFFLSLAVTIGAIVALGVAAFAALFIACLAMMSGNGNMFH